MRRMRVVLLVMSVIAGLARQAAGQTTEELKRLSLEDLLNVDVTTVSRSPEPTMRVPAAVYVITGDDLRRSGAQTLADALRLAPGVQVARISAGTWAIGVRGFADRLARSMLVLIDGRAVYSALFAGTYWETQDTFLEDVERIEVIRGPGGTLWGANAVNGIINIITKTARATHGIAGTAGAGSQDARAGARFGGAVGAAWHYRVYGKGLDRQPHFRPDGLDFDGFRTFACSGVFGGAVRARAAGYTQNLDETRPWLAVPVELAAHVPLHTTTAFASTVSAGFSLLAPIRRQAFRVDGLGTGAEQARFAALAWIGFDAAKSF